MQRNTWTELLDKIPAEYQHSLMLVTTVGLEVAIQTVLRLEDGFLTIRGRLSGTTDTGRVFFIPYDQINFLCVQKPMRDDDLSVMFGVSPQASANAVPIVVEAPPPPAAPAESMDSSRPALSPPPAEEPAKPKSAPRLSRSELLARIRSRSQGNDPSSSQ